MRTALFLVAVVTLALVLGCGSISPTVQPSPTRQVWSPPPEPIHLYFSGSGTDAARIIDGVWYGDLFDLPSGDYVFEVQHDRESLFNVQLFRGQDAHSYLLSQNSESHNKIALQLQRDTYWLEVSAFADDTWWVLVTNETSPSLREGNP